MSGNSSSPSFGMGGSSANVAPLDKHNADMAPSTTIAPSARAINTKASTFVPSSRARKAIVIRNPDGKEVSLNELKKHSQQPPTVPIPPPLPVTTSRRTASVRIESEGSKRKRVKQLRLEQEKNERTNKEGEEIKRMEEEEAKRKEEEEKRENERLRKEEEEKERLRLEEEERKRAEKKEEQERADREAGERRQREALRCEEAQLEAEEAQDIVESLEIPRRRPGPLDINPVKRDLSVPPLSALVTARNIESLQDIEYPEGVRSPREDLNKDAKDGKFRYDRDFLMQFMQFCKEKPPNLPSLDILGIEPVDPSTFSRTRGGSGRHRQPASAMAATAHQSSVGLGISSSFGTKSGAAPSSFAMGQFSTPTAKLTNEERYMISTTGTRSPSVSSGSASVQFGRPAMTWTVSQGGPGGLPMDKKRVRTKRGERRAAANKVADSQQGEGSGFGAPGPVPFLGATLEPVVPLEMSANRWVATSTLRKPGVADTESPELVERKVRALLNKLTMEKFDSISGQIIAWANKSNGRTLIRVARLVFENATHEAAWSKMYARLCRKMMETISPEVQDDSIKNSEGKPIGGGQLFRKHLLNRCQEDFERGWVTKETTTADDDQAIKVANERKGDESKLYSDEDYAVQKARRQGLGFTKFIGELFKLQMLTERIMHVYVKKLLGDVEHPEEEKIENLCQLLNTVGQLLDVPKARAHMDVYFARMKELCKSPKVSPRMQFMLQDVIELRDRRWVGRLRPLLAR